MKIEIIRADSWLALEIKVNEVIKYKNRDDIHDIKFCLETNHPSFSTESNYAIIIYK